MGISLVSSGGASLKAKKSFSIVDAVKSPEPGIIRAFFVSNSQTGLSGVDVAES